MNDCRIGRNGSLIDRNHLKLYSGIYTRIRRYLAETETARETLQHNLTIFGDGNDIWPDQCTYAISSLHSVSASVQKYCEVFDEASCILEIAALNLTLEELTVTLHYLRQQLSQLIELLTAFRTLCRTSSKQRKQKWQEITRKLNLFMHNSDYVLQRSRQLLEERPPEKLGLAPLESSPTSLQEESGDVQRQLFEEEASSLPERSRRHKHLVVVGLDYKDYEHFVEGCVAFHQLLEQSDMIADKEPLGV